MRRSKVGSISRLGVHVALSGLSVMAGWSLSAGSEIGAGMGFAGVAVALLAMLRRQPLAARLEQGAITDGPSGWQAVQRELDRSRRYERPFVLLRVPRAQSGSALPDALRPFVRNHDLLWASGENVYLLLPEATREMAHALLARIRSVQPHLLPAIVRVVAFPEDAVTGGALIALLHDQSVARHSIPFTSDPARVLETS